MNISPINNNVAFRGIFSSLFGPKPNRDGKPKIGSHLAERQKDRKSALDCSANYNRGIHKVDMDKPIKGKIDTNSMFRDFDYEIVPGVNYFLDTDTKISIGEPPVTYDLASDEMQRAIATISEGEHLYLDAFGNYSDDLYDIDDRKEDRARLTKVNQSMYILRLHPKSYSVTLHGNIEYIPSDTGSFFMSSGKKYLLDERAEIQIGGTSFRLADFNLNRLEERDKRPITRAHIAKDEAGQRFLSQDQTPLAYLQKFQGKVYLSIEPSIGTAIYSGINHQPIRASKVLPFPETLGFDPNDPESMYEPDLLPPFTQTWVRRREPEVLKFPTFEMPKFDETEFKQMPNMMALDASMGEEDASEIEERVIEANPADKSSQDKFAFALEATKRFLKGMTNDGATKTLSYKTPDGVQHLIFGTYKDGKLYRISILELENQIRKKMTFRSFTPKDIHKLSPEVQEKVNKFLESVEN